MELEQEQLLVRTRARARMLLRARARVLVPRRTTRYWYHTGRIYIASVPYQSEQGRI